MTTNRMKTERNEEELERALGTAIIAALMNSAYEEGIEAPFVSCDNCDAACIHPHIAETCTALTDEQADKFGTHTHSEPDAHWSECQDLCRECLGKANSIERTDQLWIVP